MKIQSTSTINDDRLKILVYGASGSGKTKLIGTIDEPTLIISAEAGTLCLQDKNIDVIDIQTDDDGKLLSKENRIKRLSEIYVYLQTTEATTKYKWIALDSLTEIMQNLLEGIKAMPEFSDPKMMMKLWGEYADRAKGLVKSFRDLPNYNVLMTALDKTEKDENGLRFQAIDVQGSIGERLPAYFDEVFYLYVDAEGNRSLITCKSEKLLSKDRSDRLGKIEPANIKLLIKKIKEKKTNE